MPELPNKGATPNRRYAIEFVSHWFYNIISFAGRALPAPVADNPPLEPIIEYGVLRNFSRDGSAQSVSWLLSQPDQRPEGRREMISMEGQHTAVHK